MPCTAVKVFLFQQNLFSNSFSHFSGRNNLRFIGKNIGLRKSHSKPPKFQTMTDVRNTLDMWLGFEEGFVLTPPSRSHLLKDIEGDQKKLPPRSMKDSYSTAIIPLSTQPSLQQTYASITGKLRMGRVLEDMDLFAVYTCLKHIKSEKWSGNTPSPYVIVTAAVDDLEITLEKPPVTEDVKITGNVVYTGKTSIDVRIMLERTKNNGWEKLTVADFVMVARNSTLTGPAFVNRLVPQGPDEEKEFKAAAARKEKKNQDKKASVLFTLPSQEEQKLVHEVFMKSVDKNDIGLNRRILPENCIWMDTSTLNSCVFPHPENRNHQHTVFGGYIIRLALELAYMTAYKYSFQKPSLRYITNVTFKKPVYISQFLQMKSQVIYTKENHMQIIIFIELLDVKTGVITTTHSLAVTYQVQNPVKCVVPRTYQEIMMYIEGRRHYANFKAYDDSQT